MLRAVREKEIHVPKHKLLNRLRGLQHTPDKHANNQKGRIAGSAFLVLVRHGDVGSSSCISWGRGNTCNCPCASLRCSGRGGRGDIDGEDPAVWCACGRRVQQFCVHAEDRWSTGGGDTGLDDLVGFGDMRAGPGKGLPGVSACVYVQVLTLSFEIAILFLRWPWR